MKIGITNMIVRVTIVVMKTMTKSKPARKWFIWLRIPQS